jgi:actin-related protein
MVDSPFHLVLDSGYSFTYAVPFFSGIPMKQSSLRIDVGGKLLTNLLIETISHKDFNLQGEFGLVNSMKEKTCFIAKTYEQFNELMEDCDKYHNRVNPHLREYILPDYKKIK